MKNQDGCDKNTEFESILKHIISCIPGNIYWKDIEGRYLGCNESHAKFAGLESAQDMIGKTDYDFSWKNIADILSETDQRVMRTGKPEEIIETPTLPDGTKRIILSNKFPLYSNNNKNIIGIIGTSLDITNLKNAEAQKNLALQKAALSDQKAKLRKKIQKP